MESVLRTWAVLLSRLDAKAAYPATSASRFHVIGCSSKVYDATCGQASCGFSVAF